VKEGWEAKVWSRAEREGWFGRNREEGEGMNGAGAAGKIWRGGRGYGGGKKKVVGKG